MINLAGNPLADKAVCRELETAGLDPIAEDSALPGEVPTCYHAQLRVGDTTFELQRRWYYWSLRGPVPLDTANELYLLNPSEIRAGGDCACRPPVTWAQSSEAGPIVTNYHIDTQAGLNLIVGVLRARLGDGRIEGALKAEIAAQRAEVARLGTRNHGLERELALLRGALFDATKEDAFAEGTPSLERLNALIGERDARVRASADLERVVAASSQVDGNADTVIAGIRRLRIAAEEAQGREATARELLGEAARFVGWATQTTHNAYHHGDELPGGDAFTWRECPKSSCAGARELVARLAAFGEVGR